MGHSRLDINTIKALMMQQYETGKVPDLGHMKFSSSEFSALENLDLVNRSEWIHTNGVWAKPSDIPFHEIVVQPTAEPAKPVGALPNPLLLGAEIVARVASPTLREVPLTTVPSNPATWATTWGGGNATHDHL